MGKEFVDDVTAAANFAFGFGIIVKSLVGHGVVAVFHSCLREIDLPGLTISGPLPTAGVDVKRGDEVIGLQPWNHMGDVAGATVVKHQQKRGLAVTLPACDAGRAKCLVK